MIELNWRLKILFDMYDQRQSLLIVSTAIYLFKTIKDVLIEEKKIYMFVMFFFTFLVDMLTRDSKLRILYIPVLTDLF